MVKICTNCGASVVDDQALFCNKCGSKFSQVQKRILRVCKKCGTEAVNEKSLYCNKCGTPLTVTNKEIQTTNIPQIKQEREQVVDISKKYTHLPLVAKEHVKENSLFHDETLSFNTIEKLPKSKKVPTKKIQETRCTCLACGKVWYYGKSEVFDNYAAKCRNAGKNISACTCCWPLSYMSREKTDLNKCPSCGSNAVKKEQIIHEVE